MDAAEGGSGAGGAWGDGNPVLHCRHVPASAAAEAPARRWGGLSGRRCAAACAGAALAAAACCMAIKGWPYGATRAVELTARTHVATRPAKQQQQQQQQQRLQQQQHGESISEGLSRDVLISQIKGELPDDVARSCDFTVDPCQNFYEFACGSWIKETVIPAHAGQVEKSWGLTDQAVKRQLREMYEVPHYTQPEFQRLSDWYKSCMDEEQLDKVGLSDLHRVLSHVDCITDLASLQDALTYLGVLNMQNLWSFKVNLPMGHRDGYSLYLKPSGITLNNPAIYILESPENQKLIDALRQHFTRLNILSGLAPELASATANNSLYIEVMLAKFHAEAPSAPPPSPSNQSGSEDCHVPFASDSCGAYALGDLEELSPLVPWRRIFGAIHDECKELEGEQANCLNSLLGGVHNIIPTKSSYFMRISKAMERKSFTLNSGKVLSGPSAWSSYLRTRILYDVSTLLPQPFLEANFDLDSQISGVENMPPRWQKCVRAVSKSLPYTTNSLYLALHFSPKARGEGEAIVDFIKRSFIKDLRAEEWFDEETRGEALKKAMAMAIHVGSPSEYVALKYDVSAGAYFNNSMNANKAKVLRDLSLLEQVPDRGRWNMQAYAVNAYYDNTVNGVFIPAGLLQPPFFNESAPMEQNFGGFGAIIGHEITHGFDNLGSQFDSDSNVRDWWSPLVAKEFRDRMQCIADLYSGFEIADAPVIGIKTLGENMADSGGTKIAHQALLEWYEETTGQKTSLAGERLFFVSFAQLWCEKGRKQSLQSRVQRDQHSPGPFRANGVVSQNPDFARVFSCPADSPMNPDFKCSVWADPAGAQETLAERWGGKERERSAPRALDKPRAKAQASRSAPIVWGQSKAEGPEAPPGLETHGETHSSLGWPGHEDLTEEALLAPRLP